MEQFLDTTLSFVLRFWDYVRNVVDIVIVAFVFYWLYSFLSNTRAIQLIKGFFIIVIVAGLALVLKFETVTWLIANFATYVVITIVIVFQPELRRLIAQFGQRNWLSGAIFSESFPLDELVNAIFSMAKDKVGSLIVIERNTGLKGYIESGVAINANISEELIRTIFHHNTLLHDGAIIIQGARIAAAACYLPLSESKQLKKSHGARHRAALGIAEESDALVIVTSEETGGITIMTNGKMYPKIKFSDLKNMILSFMNPKTEKKETPVGQ